MSSSRLNRSTPEAVAVDKSTRNLVVTPALLARRCGRCRRYSGSGCARTCRPRADRADTFRTVRSGIQNPGAPGRTRLFPPGVHTTPRGFRHSAIGSHLSAKASFYTRLRTQPSIGNDGIEIRVEVPEIVLICRARYNASLPTPEVAECRSSWRWPPLLRSSRRLCLVAALLLA